MQQHAWWREAELETSQQWEVWQQVLVNRARPRATGRTRPPPGCVNHSWILGQCGHLASRTGLWPGAAAPCTACSVGRRRTQRCNTVHRLKEFGHCRDTGRAGPVQQLITLTLSNNKISEMKNGLFSGLNLFERLLWYLMPPETMLTSMACAAARNTSCKDRVEVHDLFWHWIL